MAAITTRQTNGPIGEGVTNNGNPLSNAQIDQNFINLNTELLTKLPLAGGTLTGNLTGTTFTGTLRGAATGAPDATIWCVSGENPTWGIFYNEGTPDLIEFKAAGAVTASIALDTGAAVFGGVTSSNFISTLSTTGGFSAIRGAASGSANFVLQSNTTNGSAFWLSAKTNGTLHIGGNGGSEPSTGALVINANGNGNVSVSNLLSVTGQSASFPATSGTTTTGLISRFLNTGSNLVLDIGGHGGNGSWIQSTSQIDLAVNYSLLLNPNGGNVAIGLKTPRKKLDVHNGSNSGFVASFGANIGVNGWAGIHFGYSESNIDNDIYKKSGIVFERTDAGGGGGNAAGKIHILNGPAATSASATLSDAAVTITELGNVGIGITSTSYKLQVAGSFAATTKSFVIDHPTKSGMKLRYGSLEGPENGVYVRGRCKSNIIPLPEYWIKLVDPGSVTVNLTPVGSHQKLYVDKVENNCVYIATDNLFSSAIDCFYTVFAERCDVEKLQVEI
jgi:hypothetical protein